MSRSHSRTYPGNTGHRSAWSASPADPSLRRRSAPAAAFPPETFPVSGASSRLHSQYRCRSLGNSSLYIDTSFGHRRFLHAQWLGASPVPLLLLLQSELGYKSLRLTSPRSRGKTFLIGAAHKGYE